MREVVPNVLPPLTSFGLTMVATAMAAEASLSFLGLSVRRPTPTWGNMIAAGEDTSETSPHVVIVPGCVLFLTVFAINRLGDRFGSRWES